MMKINTFWITMFLCCISVGICKPSQALAADYLPTPTRNYQVERIDLNVNWYELFHDDDMLWDAGEMMTVESLSDTLSYIELDAVGLVITSVWDTTATPTEWKHLVCEQKGDSLLLITLGKTLKKGEKLVLRINYYHQTSGTESAFGARGFGFIRPLNKKQRKTAYTNSEPEDARRWMPCNDRPNDRFVSRKTICVPKGITAVSNGRLVDSVSIGDSSIFVWELNEPMPSYLHAITASEYATYQDTATRSDGSTFPIDYYIWKDYIGENGRVAPLDCHKNMMDYYQSLFFDFPYEKYGTVFVPGYGGGMENTTLTTCDISWVDNYTYIGFAHELSHSWLGDYITCAGWKDLWINEGGATWAEDMWYRHSEGVDRYYALLSQNRKSIFGNALALTSIYNLDKSNLFQATLSYFKAGWVYHMLFDALGDKFISDLRELLQKYKYTSITTEQFRDFIKEKNPDYPISWDTFFKQWLLEPGYPKVTVAMETIRRADSTSVGIIEIHQTQLTSDGVPAAFEIPIKVTYTTVAGNTINTLHYMTCRDTVFYDTLPETITNIDFWNYSFLGDIYISKVATIDELATDAGELTIYPNPAKRGEQISVMLPKEFQESANATFVLTDLSGNIVLSGEIDSGTAIIPHDIVAGVYFLSVKNKSHKYMQKMIIK